jgi:hypothetical protein
LFGGLEHLKIETRLIDEMFPSVTVEKKEKKGNEEARPTYGGSLQHGGSVLVRSEGSDSREEERRVVKEKGK